MQKSNRMREGRAKALEKRGYRAEHFESLWKPCRCETSASLEMRGVEDDGHGDAADGTGDGDGHDPGEDKETDSLPVDGLDSAVAETDTDGGSGDAHGGGDGE
jgi:hypothetical protein